MKIYVGATTSYYTEEYASTLGSTLSSVVLAIHSSSSQQYLSNDSDKVRIMVDAALALVTGLMYLAMVILHFSYAAVYLSDSIVQGFTCGCAIHIITSQISSLLGIKIKIANGQSRVVQVKINDRTLNLL